MTARVRRPIQVVLPDYGIHVFESVHAVGFTMAARAWAFHKLALVVQGSGRLEIEDRAEPLEASQLLFVLAGSEHRFVDDRNAPLSLLMVCFDDRRFESAPEEGVFREFRRAFSPGRAHDLQDRYRYNGVYSSFKKMIFEQSTRKAGYPALIVYELIRLLVFLLRVHSEPTRSGGTGRNSFASSLAYLEENFHQGIQIQELADIAGLSYRRYTTRFHQQTGKTVIRYLTERRIAYAKERLRESGNIIYSAIDSGFEDLSHFYRVFRRETGTTPRRYLLDTSSNEPSSAVGE